MELSNERIERQPEPCEGISAGIAFWIVAAVIGTALLGIAVGFAIGAVYGRIV